MIEGLEFILQNNNFLFNDEMFHQITGTAMGTIVAPTYATLVMGFLEIHLYNKIQRNFGAQIREKFEEEWNRFLDDCFIILQILIIQPEVLLNLLNSINSNIQFTMEIHCEKLPFLDILINKTEDNKIWMNIYYKETDTRRCVPFNSCHPKHCLKNIPFTLARRICAIVECTEQKKKHLDELRTILKNQKYPEKIIDLGIQKANNIPQSELRISKDKNKDVKTLAFISTHNPNNVDIFPTINKSLNLLRTHPTTKKVFGDVKLIKSLRQPKNLKRLLTSAKYTNKTNFTTSKCGDPRCECCNNILIANSYKFKNHDTPFFLKSDFNCNSSNLIYVIKCPTCKEEYIGETGEGKSKLRDRTRVYRDHIKNVKNTKLKVEKHLRECGKGEFTIFPFFQLKQNSKTPKPQNPKTP